MVRRVAPIDDPVHTDRRMSNSRFGPSIPWVLFFMVIVFIAVMPRLLISPLLLRISSDLGIGFDTASSFFLTTAFGFVVGLLCSGFVSQHMSHRTTVAVAVILVGVMTIVVAAIRSYLLFHAALAVLGWVSGLYPGSGLSSVTTIVADEHRGKALGIHESGPNLAFITAPVLAALLAPHIGWRGIMTGVGVTCILVGVAFAVYGRGDTSKGEPPHFENLSSLVKNRSFVLISVLFAVAATAALGVYSVLPTYLIVEHGLPERLVNGLIGASRVTAFASILSAGSLADRYGFKLVVLVVMGVTGVATLLLGVASGTLLLVAVFVQPMIVGGFFPVGFRAITDVISPKIRNLAVAMAIPVANLMGGGIAPPLFSAVGASGSFRPAFVVLGVVVIASVGILPFLHERRPAAADVPPS